MPLPNRHPGDRELRGASHPTNRMDPCQKRSTRGRQPAAAGPRNRHNSPVRRRRTDNQPTKLELPSKGMPSKKHARGQATSAHKTAQIRVAVRPTSHTAAGIGKFAEAKDGIGQRADPPWRVYKALFIGGIRACNRVDALKRGSNKPDSRPQTRPVNQ